MRVARRAGLVGVALVLLALGTAATMLLGPTLDPGRAARDSRLVVRAAGCDFKAGFKVLHDLIPKIVGDCIEDEHHNGGNGDALQSTSGGLLVWRKADNWTAFTDGTTTWVNGPQGIQSRGNGERFPWESDVSQSPNPTSQPVQPVPQLEQAVADAAGRTGVDPKAVQVVSVQARDWPDTSLGCPKPGMMYAQVITPGYLIVLEAGGKRFEYHADANRRVELC